MSVKNAILLVAISLFSLQFFSCQTESKEISENKTIQVEVSPEQVEVLPNKAYDDREPTADEIREFGIIKSIEDGPYPMFIVTVEFPERQFEAEFNLNAEAIFPPSLDLLNLEGSYATIYYTSTSKNLLMNLQFEGKSLYGEYAPELDDSYESITGILSGADEIAGDLPNPIYITDVNGNKMTFEEFVTEETIAINEKTVTAYYYTRGNQTITYLKKAED